MKVYLDSFTSAVSLLRGVVIRKWNLYSVTQEGSVILG